MIDARTGWLRMRAVVALVVIALAASQTWAAFTFSVQITGTADAPERAAAELIINQENSRRAALQPPLAALPKSTAAERKSSYEIALAEILRGAHASYIKQAATLSHEQRRKGYNAAPQNVQDQIDALLTPFVPVEGQ